VVGVDGAAGTRSYAFVIGKPKWLSTEYSALRAAAWRFKVPIASSAWMSHRAKRQRDQGTEGKAARDGASPGIGLDYNRDPLTTTEDIMNPTQTASGLIIEELVVGDGALAQAGQQVTVHYTGWLTDGAKFDSSKDRNDPFVFPLGGRRVIAGWDEGVQGMKVGGTRKLTIPPQLGYGARGAGGVIPPNATLVFEVELVAID
jgi:FKBP-type peptidyl-prolyl cis-trans isomerase FkpA